MSVATSVSIAPASASFAKGKTQQFTATVLDQFGADMGLAVTWSSDSVNVSINSTSGLASGDAYGGATITATYQALTSTASATVQQPVALAVITEPAGATTGSQFTTQPVIELRDVSNNPDAESGRTVTVAVQSGTGTLSGTTSVTVDSNGRAVFTNLTITGTGDHVLGFSSTGLTGANSATFSVTSQTYSTTFPTDENPLSEGGLWHHLDNEFQTPCKVLGGRACGTQTGTNNLDDSSAYLLGFGNDYEIEGIIRKAAGLTDDGISREAEILLRWTDDGATYNPGLGDTHSRGYEINMSYLGSGGLGRFKFNGSLADWTAGVTPANGDRFRARIVGQTVNVWWNDNLRLTYTDSAAGFFATGNPGIGFFIRSGANNDDFCFESVTVTAL